MIARRQLPDGRDIDGIEELKTYLVTERKRDFATGLTKRLLAAALSRDVEFRDEDLVRRLVDRFEEDGYRVPMLIEQIVNCTEFQRGY